jgi:uncharacterized membrane protein (DUF485 family)
MGRAGRCQNLLDHILMNGRQRNAFIFLDGLLFLIDYCSEYGFGSWAKFLVSSLARAILTCIQDVPVALPSIVAAMVLTVFYCTSSLISVSNIIHWHG